MDLLRTERANVFGKEVDLIAHQARAHDTGHFTCTECQAFLVGKDQHRNHMRQHTRKEKSLSLRTCTLCPYETRFKHKVNRCLARYSPLATTTNQMSWQGQAQNEQKCHFRAKFGLFWAKNPNFYWRNQKFCHPHTENPPRHLVHIGFWSDIG